MALERRPSKAQILIDEAIQFVDNQKQSKPSNENNANNDNDDNETKHDEMVAILDAGSQFGKVIDRRVRELNIESILLPFNSPASELKKYKAIIISGGPSSVYDDNAPKFDPQLFHLGIPILGICYGLQLQAYIFDGTIESGHEREDGQFNITIDNKSLLFESLPETIPVLLTHGDIVTSPGKNFKIIGKSSNGIISAIENPLLKIYGLQFHPEVDLTPDGKTIFKNFLYNIVGLKGNYTLKNRKDIAIKYIKNIVGKQKVLSLVSGGVDSSVCTALLRKALNPNQIFPVHIDSGLMRHNESSQVYSALKSIGVKIHVQNAIDDFLNGTTIINNQKTCKLCETNNPEIKRKIIGDVFMKLCDKIVKQELSSENIKFEDMILAQGTLRPDLIESASKIANKGGTADVIKTHHNDTQLVRILRAEGRVVEPLTDYHKDEVRALGEELGLPHHLVWRQPFPGPGLGIRIICTNNEPYETKFDNEILQSLKKFENENISCCLFGFRTVGVQGDGRSYSHCVGLSFKKWDNLQINNDINDTNDTNDKNDTNDDINYDVNLSDIPWNKFYKIAKDIPRKIKQINRCVFLFGKSISGHCKNVTNTKLNNESLKQLRECDKIVNDKLLEHNLMNKLSQVPVILFPSNFGKNGKRSCCIRTFITNDFMTGVPAIIDKDMSSKSLKEMVIGISKVKGIERVAFDLTPKPPGTTEWE